jgi:DNA-binding transcriptional ArsR family regulator
MAEHLPVHLLEHVAERFRVLGDSTRLAILRVLLAEGELNVGQLVERLDTSQANISKHLKILHDARIVARRPQGTSAYYSVSDTSVTQLCDVVCARLRDQTSSEARAFAAN